MIDATQRKARYENCKDLATQARRLNSKTVAQISFLAMFPLVAQPQPHPLKRPTPCNVQVHSF